MNKQQQTALNMARFIKSQSLTLLEKLDALDADEQAAMCERLHRRKYPRQARPWPGRRR
ncbi:Rop family plasmid primer RNA-binding protein, partial [Mycobacterium tuberculosis]|nr:Rop family plasmid primer RNA-binding protein [Mycobacterium tuberculosis]